jgi:hypothetical protein
MKKLFVLLILSIPFFSNAQNVGIGTNTPDASAMLDISSNSKGLLIPRLTTLQRTSIGSPTIGLTVFDSDTYSFWVYRGDVMGGWREMLIDLDKRWELNGSNIYNTNNGNVGIGTNNPQEKLSINATNPNIQLLNAGTAKGFVALSSNDMRLGTYFNNTTGKLVLSTRATDRMLIDENGQVGIGTINPSSALTLNGTNPSFQFRTGEVNKGYIKVTTDDIVFGTNATNVNGDLVFQTADIEHMRLSSTGNLGIGFSNPSAKLYINSTSLSNPAVRVLVNSSTKFMVAPNGGVVVGAYDISPPDNGLKVAGNSILTDSVTIGTETPAGTLTLNHASSFPSIVIQKNGVPIGEFIGIQNARQDIKVNTRTNDGRAIMGAYGNPFGVVVHPDAQVSMITSTKATGYQLSVNGKIMCEDLTMQNSSSWPDYVFEKDYNLKSLAEVKSFIEANKHLPNVPSAKEMEKTGIRMTEITKKLIEKVEELTLYILQQQEQIDALKKKMEEKRN